MQVLRRSTAFRQDEAEGKKHIVVADIHKRQAWHELASGFVRQVLEGCWFPQAWQTLSGMRRVRVLPASSLWGTNHLNTVHT